MWVTLTRLGMVSWECSDIGNDLEVIGNNWLSTSSQCTATVKRANTNYWKHKQENIKRSREVLLPSCTTLLRLLMEYCVQLQCQHLTQDVEEWKQFRKELTRMIWGLENVHYSERLRKLNVFWLSKRRLSGNLMSVYKYLYGEEISDRPLSSRKRQNKIQWLEADAGQILTSNKVCFFKQWW